jgi:hypothetical protein
MMNFILLKGYSGEKNSTFHRISSSRIAAANPCLGRKFYKKLIFSRHQQRSRMWPRAKWCLSFPEGQIFHQKYLAQFNLKDTKLAEGTVERVVKIMGTGYPCYGGTLSIFASNLTRHYENYVCQTLDDESYTAVLADHDANIKAIEIVLEKLSTSCVCD